MVDFTPITVGDDRPIAVTLSNNASKFADIDTMMTRVQVLFAALDPTGPSGPVNPDGTSSGIPMRFKTEDDQDGNPQIVQASVTSTAALQRDLNGLTFTAGEAFITSTSNANAFGTSVGRGDAMMAKVDNPAQDITNTTDWLRVEGDDSYSITLSERQFINTLNEDDVAVRVADPADTVTVTFYLLSTAATVDGDLTGGQTGSFHQTADQRNGILYVRLSSVYVTGFGADRIYVEIVDPGGGVSTFVALSSFTERTDLLVGGDDVFESLGFTHGTSINYAGGQTIRLWRTRNSREWYFGAAFDVLRGLENNSIGIEKLTPSVQALIRDRADLDIGSLESQLQVLRPLARDVNILTDWADIYNPAQASEVVRIVDEYSLIADFRGTASTEHYESSGVIYVDGTNVIDYSGLTDDLFRSFGFEVSGASNLTLMSLGNGGTVIPFIDITSGGNFRLNNFTPARTITEVISDHYVAGTLSVGTGVLSVGGAASTYVIPGYPSDTDEATRTASLDLDIFINGVDSGAGGFVDAQNGFTIPNDETAQAKQVITRTFFLGPLTGRTVSVQIGYEFRKDGADFLLDLTLETAPPDVTLSVQNVETFQSYTATNTIARVDNWLVFGTGAGNFVFSGEHEFLIEIVPRPGNPDQIEVVGAAINASTGATTEFNDIYASIPPDGFDEIQIPDTIEFRTFKTNHYITHSGLSSFLGDRATQWAYGLARRETVTGHAVTEIIDLAANSTMNSALIKSGADDVFHQATGTGTGAGELIQNLVLPVDYADYDYLHITEYVSGSPNEWRSAHLAVDLLTSGDVGASDVIRIQGATEVTWTPLSRTLTSQGGQTIWRAALRTQ